MPRKPRTTARFFVMHSGGLVTKVKLRPGQTTWHFDRTEDDEGYSSICRSWHFDGDKVTLAWVRDSRDCDGRMRRQGMSECFQRDLMSGYRDADGTRWPRWMETYASQRDYSAEAAGY